MENMAVSANFWRGKKVFITGHTGFKGSWLSLWLQSLGAEVSGYALAPTTSPNLYELANVGEKMDSQFADVSDLSALTNALQRAKPQIVFHMAAQALVRASYENPIQTYQTNVMGTVHLLEAIRQCSSVKALVNVTTDKCYENREWVWGYRETEAIGGFDPYSSSKGCAELVSAAYRNSFFPPDRYAEHGFAMATARAGNVIGGGDWSRDRLIPDLLSSFQAKLPARIRNPSAIRPWQHVLEPLRGYLILAQALFDHGVEFGEPFNFGPNDHDAWPVSSIADHLVRLWGVNSQWQADIAEHPHEAHYLKLDISKAKSKLAWQPIMTLSQALEQIVIWAKAHELGQDMRKITLKQIQEYQQLQEKGVPS
jgi:CDP-glucose 4,6-dehydratase